MPTHQDAKKIADSPPIQRRLQERREEEERIEARIDGLHFYHIQGTLDASRISNLGFGAISGTLSGQRIMNKSITVDQIVMNTLWEVLDNRYARSWHGHAALHYH